MYLLVNLVCEVLWIIKVVFSFGVKVKIVIVIKKVLKFWIIILIFEGKLVSFFYIVKFFMCFMKIF